MCVCVQLYGPSWREAVEFKGIKKLWCSNHLFFPFITLLMSALALLAGPVLLLQYRRYATVDAAAAHRRV